jgi:hypothetical protein
MSKSLTTTILKNKIESGDFRMTKKGSFEIRHNGKTWKFFKIYLDFYFQPQFKGQNIASIEVPNPLK